MNDQWLIWSIEHNAWWGRNSHGYTQYVSGAGLYSFAEACQIVHDANSHEIRTPKEAMVRKQDFGSAI